MDPSSTPTTPPETPSPTPTPSSGGILVFVGLVQDSLALLTQQLEAEHQLIDQKTIKDLLDQAAFQEKVLDNPLRSQLFGMFVRWMYQKIKNYSPKNEVSPGETHLEESIVKYLKNNQQLLKEIAALNKDLQEMHRAGQVEGEMKEKVMRQVQEVCLQLFSIAPVRAPLAARLRRGLELWESNASKSIPKALLHQLDALSASPDLLRALESHNWTAITEALLRELLLPVAKKLFQHIKLPPINLTLTDNPISKINLKLEAFAISIPALPSKFKISSSSEMDFDADKENPISSAPFNMKLGVSIPDISVEMPEIFFDYSEEALFLSLKEKGKFELKVKSMAVQIPLEVKKQGGGVVVGLSGKVGISIGFTKITFQNSGNDVILNKLSSTFNGRICEAIAGMVQKKVNDKMGSLVEQVNEWIGMVIGKEEKEKEVIGKEGEKENKVIGKEKEDKKEVINAGEVQ